jgi:hypothetical protein
MKVLKAAVAIKDGDGSLFAADVISHDGKNWIVPTWHECPAEGYKKPERIVCLDNLRHQKTRSGDEFRRQRSNTQSSSLRSRPTRRSIRLSCSVGARHSNQDASRYPLTKKAAAPRNRS